MYNYGADGADDWQECTLINSAEEFNGISKAPAGNYALTGDIDFEKVDVTPISLSGNFGGNGYSVKNATIKSGDFSVGLFSDNGGIITDLYVENANIVGENAVGGICGDNGGIIRNCVFSGTVVGTRAVGGICARSDGGTIENCYVIGSITGREMLGGVCGYLFSSTVKNCYSVCTVPDSGVYVGSLFGNNDSYNTITGCYYDNNISKRGAIGDSDGSSSDGNEAKGLTTKELCEALPAGYGGSVWTVGSYSDENVNNNAKLRKIAYTYPSLDGVGKAYSVEKYEYNFGMNCDDWQECTLITTPDEFIAIGSDEAKWSGNYVLGADIDLADKVFAPIGKSEESAFTGKFSGNGYSIKNAVFSGTNNYYYPVGLFGCNDGLITDLYVENAVITGYNAVGGICGINGYYGTTRNCAFSGTVKGMQNVGGICGISNGGTIENCYRVGDILGVGDSGFESMYIGGICGYNSSYCSIKNCFSAGRVSGDLSIGSIIGLNTDDTNANVKNCYYDKNVSSLGAVGVLDSSASKDNDANNVKGLALAELCGTNLPAGFDGSVWTVGKVETSASDGSFRTVKYTYPSLKSLRKACYVERKEYNFKTGSTDNWREFTFINTTDEYIAITKDPAKWSGSYVLGDDLDFGGEAILPIGSSDDTLLQKISDSAFTGCFSGNGHTIRNLVINKSHNDRDDFAALFGYVYNGVIMDLAAEGKIESTGEHVGGICGHMNNGTIYRCSFDGTVGVYNSPSEVGGIVGSCINSKIQSCFSSADVSGFDKVGGICGEVVRSGDSSYHSTLEYCVSVGKVDGMTNVGGICYNELDDHTVISYCVYDNEVSTGLKAVGGDTCTTSNVYGAGTATLCSAVDGFTSPIWKAGDNTITPTENGSRFGERTARYISLDGIGEAKTVAAPVYNFKTSGADDWAKYTLITTAKEFAAIGNDESYGRRMWSENYVLGADIDLGNKATTCIGDDFVKYTGKFSGDGHLFKNAASPLFGINNGLIKHITIESGAISSELSSGGICKDNQTDGVIYCCGNNADVEVARTNIEYSAGGINSRASAGGICAENKGVVEYCYNTGLITDAKLSDPVCRNGTTNYCYYDELCGSAASNSLDTVGMTSGIFTGFDKNIWTKKPNTIDSESGAGVAYYHSFSEKFAPSIGFTATLEFSIDGDKTLVYGDDIVFTANEKIEFDNGYTTSGLKPTAAVLVDGSAVVQAFSSGKASYTVKTVGKTTFTLVHENDYYNGAMTKDLTVDIEKAELTAADFDFAAAADLVFNNKEKAATVTAKPGMEGVGEIAVKYYSGDEELKSVPINAGNYTVKIAVAEGDFYKAAELEDSTWAFTITKAAAPSVPKIELSYNWQTDEDVTIFVPGLPENMGAINGYAITPPEHRGNSFEYSDRKLFFHVGPYSESKVGDTVLIMTDLFTQNYEDFYFLVEVSINDKANKEAPSLDDFDLVFTENGSVITAAISTALEGVEYSFDGAYWSSENTLDAGHDKLVTAYIRYAQTDDMNASAPVSKQANSGHGTLVHHERVEPDCVKPGAVEYWECELCARYFLDENCEDETTSDGTVLAAAGHSWSAGFEADVSGHWHKCEKCDATTPAEKHTSGGAATEETPESCIVCGYVITPETGHIHANHLTEIPARAATCTEDGNTAYFRCSCGMLFTDSTAATEVTAADVTIKAAGHKWSEKYEYDKSGHWHKCEKCDAASSAEKHVSSGEATTARAETCTVCGYEISPKKTNGVSNTGGSGSGGSGGGSSRPSGKTETLSALNGVQKSWADIASDLKKPNGGSTVIHLNGPFLPRLSER